MHKELMNETDVSLLPIEDGATSTSAVSRDYFLDMSDTNGAHS